LRISHSILCLLYHGTGSWLTPFKSRKASQRNKHKRQLRR
jgi:hypothetical protein